MVQIFGAVGEWILGNTFPCALFFTYGTLALNIPQKKVMNIDLRDAGTFWIVQGTTMIPWFGVGTNYSPTGNSLEGMQTPEFAASTGLSMILLPLQSLSVTDISLQVYTLLLLPS